MSNVTKYKHNINSIIEVCAEILQKHLGFNPKQVLRYFHLFPLGEFN